MSFKMKYSIKEDLLPKGTKRRSGTKNLGVRFVVLHDTGNPNSTASGNVNYYKDSANSQEASAHIFVDDKEIIICVPLNEKAWHVLYNVTTDNKMYGDDANDIAIGVELSYFPKDKARTQKAYEKYLWVCAWLAHTYNINPKTGFVGHNILDPARKVDPTNALKIIGKTYRNLLDDIVKEYDECVKQVKGVIKEEDEVKVEQPKFKPSSKAIFDSSVEVMKELEKDTKDAKGLNANWRVQMLNGDLTDSDAIGLIFVAIQRGLMK